MWSWVVPYSCMCRVSPKACCPAAPYRPYSGPNSPPPSPRPGVLRVAPLSPCTHSTVLQKPASMAAAATCTIRQEVAPPAESDTPKAVSMPSRSDRFWWCTRTAPSRWLWVITASTSFFVRPASSRAALTAVTCKP